MQLKKNQPPFEIVDGPGKGQYVHGEDYELKDIPKEYRSRFEKPKAAAKKAAANKGGNDK